ncbi:response regulator transcription factor [Paenibacillus caui]|uniref:response regulator transcription factor n=1 Tax=Paenibacillus caui TaxID=2873927 RepID=UPI001CA897B1|nr:response regulator transcription factor [Paenibacillus caui]
MTRTILVVDDDRDIVRLISDSLQYEQFSVIPAYSGQDALNTVEREDIDFMILDIMMPGLDGLEVCRKVRRKFNVPILILSARDRDIDKVIGLEIGADDYMTKPFSLEELTSRVKAHFRKLERMHSEWRSKEAEALSSLPGRFSVGLLQLQETTYEAFLEGSNLDLSVKEFQILSYLVRHPNQVLSREQIYESVWGDEFGDINTVTVHIKNIRKKMGKTYDFIRTVWGIGYKFSPEGCENEA